MHDDACRVLPQCTTVLYRLYGIDTASERLASDCQCEQLECLAIMYRAVRYTGRTVELEVKLRLHRCYIVLEALQHARH
jgi:hypothetical protein